LGNLCAATGSFVSNTTVPLTFTPSFDLSGSPRVAAAPAVVGGAGHRTRRSPIRRVAGSLCTAVGSVVSNITASTYLHPVTLYL
jgi:hypothetical protein